jgi:hypothetical protein
MIRLSLLSIGSKSLDDNRHDIKLPKLFTPFSALNTKFSLSVRYFIIDSVSIKGVYNLGIYQIKAWDPFLASNNFLIASFAYHF